MKVMMMGSREESLVSYKDRCRNYHDRNLFGVSYQVVVFSQEEVLAPPPQDDDVINDFDIEEEVIEVEKR